MPIPFLIAAAVLWLVFRGVASLGIKKDLSGNGLLDGHAPSCAVCGFDVRGLRELRCPECGSNLLEVGIVGSADSSPRYRSSRGLVAGIVWWTLFYPAVLFFGSMPYWSAFAPMRTSIPLLALLLTGWLSGLLVVLIRHRRRTTLQTTLDGLP